MEITEREHLDACHRREALRQAMVPHDGDAGKTPSDEEVLARARLYYAFLKGEEQEGR